MLVLGLNQIILIKENLPVVTSYFLLNRPITRPVMALANTQAHEMFPY